MIRGPDEAARWRPAVASRAALAALALALAVAGCGVGGAGAAAEDGAIWDAVATHDAAAEVAGHDADAAPLRDSAGPADGARPDAADPPADAADAGSEDVAPRGDTGAPDGGDAPDGGAPDGGDVGGLADVGPFFPNPACEPLVESVTVRGFVYVFGPGDFTEGAPIEALEDPTLTAALDARGRFTMEGVPPCRELTLRLFDPALRPTQTGTFFVGNEDLEQVAFQSPSPALFDLFLQAAGASEDPTRCQVVTTLTRGGDAWLSVPHGVEGGRVFLDPAAPEAGGPVYFAYHDASLVFPDRSLTETSVDGGAGFLNVPPGDYLLRGSKDGMVFTVPWVKCRAGWFVNAAPPWGVTEVLD